MEKILIKNAILVNENKISQKDLLIKGEYIFKIDDFIEEVNVDRTIDAKGLYLIPGWIDDQVHFREPGLTHKGGHSLRVNGCNCRRCDIFHGHAKCQSTNTHQRASVSEI